MSISLDNLNLYTSDTSSISNSNASQLTNTLNNLDNSSDEELMDACKSFEAYFLEQVFKSMEKTVMKNEDDSSSSSSYVDYFKENLYQSYAENATESGGYGIAQMLYESMKR